MIGKLMRYLQLFLGGGGQKPKLSFYWRDSATAEERQDMKERLKNGFGYIR